MTAARGGRPRGGFAVEALRVEEAAAAFGSAASAFFFFFEAAASASATLAGVGLLCRRPATGAMGGRGATSGASTRLPPALPEALTVAAGGRTTFFAPNLFPAADAAEISDCGGVGSSPEPRMGGEGAPESCASIPGGVGDIGAGGKAGGKERRRAGRGGHGAGGFLGIGFGGVYLGVGSHFYFSDE